VDKNSLPDTELKFVQQIYNEHAEHVETEWSKPPGKCVLMHWSINERLQSERRYTPL
jgi:hypothetical protein